VKRRHMLGAALALTAERASSATISDAGRLQRLTIATGPKGTAYQLIGQELAACVKELHPGCDVQVLVTAGGVNNMNLMREGRVDIAFVNASVAWAASLGILEFQGGRVPLRAMAALYPNSMHLVVREDSGINRLADLRTRRVATGSPGSGTEVLALQMLVAMDIDPDHDLQRRRWGLDESIKALREGRLDAFLFGAAVPVRPIAELMGAGGVRLVSDADAIQGMNRIYSSLYREGTIPPNTYPRQPLEVRPLDVWDLLVATEHVPGDWVFDLTRALFERRERFVAAHPNMRFLGLRNQDPESTVSFHLGAKRYFATQGLQPFAHDLGYPGQAVPGSASASAIERTRP